MARKTYNRRFRKNGRSFMVQDTYRQDRKGPDENYYLTMKVKNGWFKIVHDPFGEIPKFRTIREAQNYAFCCGEFIDKDVW